MIETSYDPEADVFSVRFGPAGAVYVEFDSAGNPIGVEITRRVRRHQTAQVDAKAAAE